MGVDLKFELAGAVMFARRKTEAGEKLVALLLGRGTHHHGLEHRPTLTVDPYDVQKVHDLPTRVILTKKHQARLVIDLSGLDLILQDADAAGVEVDEDETTNLPSFKRVVDMSHLLVDPQGTAKIASGLVDRANPPSDPQLIVGRLFLDAGRLGAAAPFDRAHRDVEWSFDYKEPKGVPVHKAQLTDRSVFRCRLQDATLRFERVGQRDPRIEFDDKGSPVNLRIACLPTLPERGVMDVQASGSHFKMAYDVLDPSPAIRPEPYLPVPPPHDLVTNCFPQGQAQMS